MASIISVLQTKGGAGKTTISLNLARAFQLGGLDVVVVDSDPQGTARSWSSISSETSPPLFPVYGISHNNLKDELKRARSIFDVIIFDGMAKMEPRVLAPAITSSDLVLIPVRPSGADIFDIEDLVEALVSRAIITGGSPVSRFVVSACTKGTTMAGQIDDVLLEMGIPVLSARTSHLVAYPDAITSGATVFDMKGKSKSAENARSEIEAIKKEIMGFLNVRGQVQEGT